MGWGRLCKIFEEDKPFLVVSLREECFGHVSSVLCLGSSSRASLDIYCPSPVISHTSPARSAPVPPVPPQSRHSPYQSRQVCPSPTCPAPVPSFPIPVPPGLPQSHLSRPSPVILRLHTSPASSVRSILPLSRSCITYHLFHVSYLRPCVWVAVFCIWIMSSAVPVSCSPIQYSEPVTKLLSGVLCGKSVFRVVVTDSVSPCHISGLNTIPLTATNILQTG